MGRIILSAGHYQQDPGAKALGTTEAREMKLTRDLIERELEARGQEFISVPDWLDLRETLRWIREHSCPTDVSVEIHGNAFDGTARGAEAYYIAQNPQRQEDAELLLNGLIDAVREIDPNFPDRGAKPDNGSQFTRLAFCRDVALPSVLMELCFIDNPQDLNLLQNHREQFAKGLAEGLIRWSARQTKPEDYTPITIQINNRDYEEKGIYVYCNAYIPVDLAELLGVSRTEICQYCQVEYGGVVYIKAVELEEHNFSVDWHSASKTVAIQQKLPDGLEEIMHLGEATVEQFRHFLQQNNAEALQQFPNLPELYAEKADAENVNRDVAFCQMCLETGYLKFGGLVQSGQNNFCGLGAVGGGDSGASFSDPETGVKAHVQHLKAYGCARPVNEPPVVDPRFDLVPRDVADTVYDLSGRWAADPEYGEKIMAIARRLHGIV